MSKSTKTKKEKPDVNYIGKFASIKEGVKLIDNLTQIYNYPYKIIDQEKITSNAIRIKLETYVHASFASNFSSTFEVQDRSFWMNLNDCNIIYNA